MKNKITHYNTNSETGVSTITIQNKYGHFTGEAFFAPAISQPTSNTGVKKSSSKDRKTIPPVKLLRLKLQEKSKQRDSVRYELAPTAQNIYEGEVETSDYASKDVEDNFEDMTADGFESELEVTDEEKAKRSFFKL